MQALRCASARPVDPSTHVVLETLGARFSAFISPAVPADPVPGAEDRTAAAVCDRAGPDTLGSSPCYPASASLNAPRSSVEQDQQQRGRPPCGQDASAERPDRSAEQVTAAQGEPGSGCRAGPTGLEVGPTTEDLQRFIDIISQEVEDPGLELAQVEAEIRETTPFAGVLQFLGSSQNRTELVAYLGLLLVVIQTVLMLTQKPVVVATPDQVQEIIERVVEQVERDQSEPSPTTQPDCGQEPQKGQRAQGN
jgi:hypothetical protein